MALPSTKIDDEILASIPGLEEFVGQYADSDDSQTEDTSQSIVAEQDTNTSGNSGSQQTDTQSTNAGQSTDQTAATNNQTEQVIQRKDGLVEVPNKDNPRTRDLVNPLTGQVVAHGGIERNVFEQAQRHRRENDTLKQRLQTLETQVNGANSVSQTAMQLQLPPQEQIAAIQAFAEFKRDPVRLLEQLVAEVKAKGYEIPFLEQGVSAGIDTRAINTMLDQKLAPIMSQQQEVQARTQAYNQAEQQLNSFLEEIPEAQANLEVIGQMITSDPSLTLDKAYLNLVRWCSMNGLDPSSNIQAQLQARNGQQTQQAPSALQTRQNPASRNTSTAPLPMNGRGAAQTNQREAQSSYDESSSWRDIVRQAMNESGMSVTQ